MINNRLDESIEMLKDLEMIESNMIQTVFEYNKMNKEEMKADTREIVLDHRSGTIDPAASKLSKNQSKKARKEMRNKKNK